MKAEKLCTEGVALADILSLVTRSCEMLQSAECIMMHQSVRASMTEGLRSACLNAVQASEGILSGLKATVKERLFGVTLDMTDEIGRMKRENRDGTLQVGPELPDK